MSIKWNRLCKTCNAILSNDQEAKYHQQTYAYHKVESNKEAYDRSFKLLAFQFKNSFSSYNSNTNRPRSASSLPSSSNSVPSTNIVFAPNSTVPLSEYKDSNITFNNQRLVFISDDQESFEPLYGNSEHSDKESEEESNANLDPTTKSLVSKNPNIDLYNKSPPSTAASSSYFYTQYPQANYRNFNQHQAYDQNLIRVGSHPQPSSSSHHEEPEPIPQSAPIPSSSASSQQHQHPIGKSQIPLNTAPQPQRYQSYPALNPYMQYPPRTAPHNTERAYSNDSYRTNRSYRRISVDYSMYSGSSAHKERISRREYKGFVGLSNRPRPLSQGDGILNSRVSQNPHPLHTHHSMNAPSMTSRHSYSINNSGSSVHGYSSGNSNSSQANVPYQISTTAPAANNNDTNAYGYPQYAQHPYQQLQHQQQGPISQLSGYHAPPPPISAPYERSSLDSNSRGSFASTQPVSFGPHIAPYYRHTHSAETNSIVGPSSFSYDVSSTGRINSASSSQRPSTASSSVSSIHNSMYFDNSPDSRKNSICFSVRREPSYIVAENRESNGHYPPAHPAPPVSQPQHHQGYHITQQPAAVPLRAPNFDSPGNSSAPIGIPSISTVQQPAGTLPSIQQQQTFPPPQGKYANSPSPVTPQTENNSTNKMRNTPNNDTREYRRY